MEPSYLFAAFYGVTFAGLLVWLLWKFAGVRRSRQPPGPGPSPGKERRHLDKSAATRAIPAIDKDLLRRHLEWFFTEIQKGRTEINGFLIQDPGTIEGLRCIGLESASYSGRVLCDLSIDASGISELDTSNFGSEEAYQDLRKIPIMKCFVNPDGMGLVYFDGARYQSRSLTDRNRNLPTPPLDTLRRFYGLPS